MQADSSQLVTDLLRRIPGMDQLQEVTEPPQPSPNESVSTKNWLSLKKSLLVRDNPIFRQKVLGLDESHAKTKKMSRWAEAFLKAAALNDRSNGHCMILAGPTGTAKTHVLRKVFRFLSSNAVSLWETKSWPMDRIPSPCFAVWSKVVALQHDTFEDWFSDAERASWILLDDIGSEVDKFKSGEPTERLRRVMELGRTRWMLISTNVLPTKWVTTFDARVASRLSAAKCLDLSGVPDYRTAKGKI